MAADPKMAKAAQAYAKKKASAKAVAGEPPAKSKGAKLDAKMAKALEESLGKKINQIKVHTGKEAKDACKQLGAKAFTHGNNIYFSSTPNPDLLAHAAAHVIQQKGRVAKGKVNKIK